MPETTPAIGVLISGRGSNLQALIDAIDQRKLPAAIAVVISNRPDAGGLDRARAAGIETLVIEHRHVPQPRRLRPGTRERIACASRVARLPGRVHALDRNATPRRVPKPDPQRPSVAAAFVSRRRCPAAGPRARCEVRWRHRSPRDGRTRWRSDRAAGDGPRSRRRHGRDVVSAHPDRGAPDLSGGRAHHARRRLERHRPPVATRADCRRTAITRRRESAGSVRGPCTPDSPGAARAGTRPRTALAGSSSTRSRIPTPRPATSPAPDR